MREILENNKINNDDHLKKELYKFIQIVCFFFIKCSFVRYNTTVMEQSWRLYSLHQWIYLRNKHIQHFTIEGNQMYTFSIIDHETETYKNKTHFCKTNLVYKTG